MKKNLVLGAAKGYSRDMLEPFVDSFIKNCSNADLILVVDDISDFTREYLLEAGALLGTFPDELKSGIPNNTRWKIFSDLLEAYGDNYEQIFITDTRDVIFQGDIFKAFEKYPNYLGYATELDDIRGSKTGSLVNYRWIVDCFGKDEADKLLDKKIICDGTVIGTPAEMKIFTEKMWKAVFAVEQQVDFRIHDQAIANYLIYNDFFPIRNWLEIDVDYGEIFTMGLVSDFFIRDNLVLRPTGKIPSVVHQYNRHESLIWLIDDIYHDKNFQVDERFTDMRSIIEQATALLFANKIGDATKLFMKKFLVAKDFKGCVGALTRLWEIAMRNPLSPAIELLELSAQSALKSAGEISILNLEKICMILNSARECHHAIDPEFKNFIVNVLFKTAEQTFAANEIVQCLYCLETLRSLIAPVDENSQGDSL